MSGRLRGQTAWISGGASGIGEATVRLFASEGARVAIVDVQSELGRRLEDSLRREGSGVAFIECDVSEEHQVRDSIERTIERFGCLQIVVNNAGVVHVKPLHDYAESEWDRLMGVNLKSIFFSVKYAISYLRKNAPGYVVNVGSISSFVGQAETPAYTASKFAVLGLSRSIALDYAAVGVRCNCVCPGITDTPMLRHHLETAGNPTEALSRRLHRIPMGRSLTSADIARAILYLSCEDSAGVTGTSVVIDGGYLAAAEWEHQKVIVPDDLS
jgi:NAD(P)-dependent dehydrogenase (short-subunit alcohol dehydrogenase family)